MTDIEVTNLLRNLLLECGLTKDQVIELIESLSGFDEGEIRSISEEIANFVPPPDRATQARDIINRRVEAKKKVADVAKTRSVLGNIESMRRKSEVKSAPNSNNEP